MTDEQIIKALECCSSSNVEHCRKCPLISQKDELFSCLYQKQILSLDLINRQKAKNEREINQIKSEAIKEFAERLKGYAIGENGSKEKAYFFVEVQDIDNLVKEMMEEQK